MCESVTLRRSGGMQSLVFHVQRNMRLLQRRILCLDGSMACLECFMLCL